MVNLDTDPWSFHLLNSIALEANVMRLSEAQENWHLIEMFCHREVSCIWASWKLCQPQVWCTVYAINLTHWLCCLSMAMFAHFNLISVVEFSNISWKCQKFKLSTWSDLVMKKATFILSLKKSLKYVLQKNVEDDKKLCKQFWNSKCIKRCYFKQGNNEEQ